MPELPEIETVKLQLEKHLVGQNLVRVDKLHPKSVIGEVEEVEGKRVEKIERKGKMLIINLEGEIDIAIHFKMSGQLILTKNQELRTKNLKNVLSPTFKVQSQQSDLKNRIVGGHPTEDWVGKLPSKHTRAIFHFESGDTMYFNDQRIFGWVEVSSKFKDQSSKKRKYMDNLGPEPWDINPEEFHKRITKGRRTTKIVIMDQSVISGVGNIYANDGLWEARLHPSMQVQILGYEDTKRLRAGLVKVLNEGIKYGGATAADAKYMNLHGMGGHYQDHFRTYHRTGEKCLRNDGGIIKKIVLGGRGTYFCPVCQK